MYHQTGGGACSLCRSPGTTKITCPWNPKAKNPNPAKHPLAKGKPPAGKTKPPTAKPPKPLAPAPIDDIPAPAADCINPATLMGDDVNVIDPLKFYRAWTGNCFDIEEDLFPYLLSGKTTDPYTNQPLWRNNAERDEIIKHPGLTAEQQGQLHVKLLGGNPLTKDTQALIKRNKKLFHLIGTVGLILYGDYHPDFAPSQEALAYLDNELSKSRDDAKLRDLHGTGLGATTLAEIMAEQGSACIHGIGMRLIRMYLSLYMVMGGKPVMGSLPKGYNRVQNANTITYTVYAVSDPTWFVGIYLHDEETYGRSSKLGHLGYVGIKGTTQEWRDFVIAEGRGGTSSQISYPTAREVGMYKAAQDEIAGILRAADSEEFSPWPTMIPFNLAAFNKLIRERKLPKGRKVKLRYYEVSGRDITERSQY